MDTTTSSEVIDQLLDDVFDDILLGEASEIGPHVQAALDNGVEPLVILNQGMIAGLRAVGVRFEDGECFVPELLYAARAMQAGLLVLKPHLPKGQVNTSGTVLIGTVQGDMHDIGKNLVGLLLEGAGFAIHDLGTNVPPEAFVRAVRAERPDILALSALLTTTMQSMATTIAALEAAGVRDQLKIIVGGAPVTEAFARHIGADGYAPDASRAVALVEALLTR